MPAERQEPPGDVEGRAQRALEAAPLDEIHLPIVPILFGGGRRLIDIPEATHVRNRVLRWGRA